MALYPILSVQGKNTRGETACLAAAMSTLSSVINVHVTERETEGTNVRTKKMRGD